MADVTAGWVLPDDVLRDAPSYAPRPYELADLELLLSGAFAPLTGFLGQADLASLARRGRLADGTSWPVPVTLQVPEEAVAGLEPDNPLRRVLVLTAPEGAPVAAIDAREIGRGTPQSPERTVAAVADPADRATDAVPALPYRPAARPPTACRARRWC